MAVANFAPELLELYRRARREAVRVPLATRKQATKLRHRLYQLRKDMRKESHPDTMIAEGVSFSIITEGDTVILIGSPADNSYVEAIRKAGVDVSEPKGVIKTEPKTTTDTVTPTPSSSASATAQAISDMFKKE